MSRHPDSLVSLGHGRVGILAVTYLLTRHSIILILQESRWFEATPWGLGDDWTTGVLGRHLTLSWAHCDLFDGVPQDGLRFCLFLLQPSPAVCRSGVEWVVF